MYFDLKKLYICKAGNTINYKEKKGYKFFDEIGYIVAKMDYYQEKYIDIFSKTSYRNFHDKFCSVGEPAVMDPISLSLFIQKGYAVLKKNETLKKIADKVIKNDKISTKDIKTLLLYMNNEKTFEEDTNKKKKNINITYFNILNNKKYKLQPCVGRDEEINKLITSLAQEKTNSILVGPSGIGKKTIVEGLVYKIKNNEVPPFLKNKKIINLDLTNLNIYDKFNLLEEKLLKLIEYAKKNNYIIFIDKIENIYNYKMSEIILNEINKNNIKIIGTTNEENYYEYFNNSFDEILINEPNNDKLKEIINKILDDYTSNTNITLYDKESLIEALINVTNVEYRVSFNNSIKPDDNSYNPYLVLNIIDRMFSYAKANNLNKLDTNSIMYGINNCDKLCSDSYQKALTKKKLAE